MFSARYNPWMRAVEAMADSIRPGREPLPETDPAIRAERKVAENIGAGLTTVRQARDQAIAAIFMAMFAPGVGAFAAGKE